MQSFTDYGLDPVLLRNLEEMDYAIPTQVQAKTIPAALQGKNLVVTAETGSGKTAAFLLPIFQRLLSETGGRTRALVLSPTREIAAQTVDFAKSIGSGTGVRSVAVYGGVAMGPQENALRGGYELVVATPGRLLDHLGRRNARLDSVSTLIIDEADRMMDMGFMPDLRRVLSHVPMQRQTMLFSATMPQEILRLVKAIMSDPVRIEIGTVAMPPETVEQIVFPVAQDRKKDLLLALLRGETGERLDTVLVFCRTRRRAERLARDLARARLRVSAIHGDRTQAQRELALGSFRNGEVRVLVATDVAARGLDVEGISHVVNYDLPEVAEAYVHRIGRTARAGAAGKAYSFVAAEDRSSLSRIEAALGQRIPRFTVTDFTRGRGESEDVEPAAGPQVVSSTARTIVASGRGGARPTYAWPRQ